MESWKAGWWNQLKVTIVWLIALMFQTLSKLRLLLHTALAKSGQAREAMSHDCNEKRLILDACLILYSIIDSNFMARQTRLRKKNKPWLKVRNIIIAYIASMNNMTGFTGYISIYIVTSILLFNKMRTCICVPLGNVRMPRPSCSRCMGRSSCAPVVSIGA